MTTLHVPLIEREDLISKYIKMITTIAIAIFIILCLFQAYDANQCKIQNMIMDRDLIDIKWDTEINAGSNGFEPFESDIPKIYENSPVKIKYVVVQNINKKLIPIRKIIVIDIDRNLTEMSIDESSMSDMGESGLSITFELPYEITATQIVLDVNSFCESNVNLHTTQMVLKDIDNNIVWENIEPFRIGKRYVYVYMVKHRIIYDEQMNGLCRGKPNDSDTKQELILNKFLSDNIWVE